MLGNCRCARIPVVIDGSVTGVRMHPLTDVIREDARKLSWLAVLVNGVEPRVEVMFPPGWPAVVHYGNADVVVGGALTGALQALRFRGATARDALACPTQHSEIDAQAMEVAVGWVTRDWYSLRTRSSNSRWSPRRCPRLVWMNRQAHVESLVHATRAVARVAALRCAG